MAKKVLMDTNWGAITIELWPDKAPKTVDNFLKLVKNGFYNGLQFHRVIKGFMMQGGCPKGTGMGGPGYQIKAEFNDTKHVAGVLSMARSGDPDSAGSQFFIVFDAAPHLDKQYTAFGKVIDGMDVVKSIEAIPCDANDRPKKLTKMEKVTVIEE